jgi:hypothetical protein
MKTTALWVWSKQTLPALVSARMGGGQKSSEESQGRNPESDQRKFAENLLTNSEAISTIASGNPAAVAKAMVEAASKNPALQAEVYKAFQAAQGE